MRIVLLVSSLLEIGTALAGIFSLALGIVHVWVPRIFAFRPAIGPDDGTLPAIGALRLGPWAYARRRSDLVGLSWVMSNAASYVLISIGIIDLAWAVGDRSIPLGIGAIWIAGWWTLRAAGQFTLGWRTGDVAMAALFLALASGHVVLAVGPGAS